MKIHSFVPLEPRPELMKKILELGKHLSDDFKVKDYDCHCCDEERFTISHPEWQYDLCFTLEEFQEELDSGKIGEGYEQR